MLCGWEGNRRSCVALATRHRLSGLSTYGLRKGDEHPAYTPVLVGVCGTLYLFYVLLSLASSIINECSEPGLLLVYLLVE